MKSLKIKIILILLTITLFCNCSKKENINDDFRNNIVSKIKLQKDTLKTFEILLDKLDEKNITFGEYTKRVLYTIPDSCSTETNKKFKIDPVYVDITQEMYEYTDKITKISRIKYDAKFKIDQKTAEMATFIVVSYPEIKKYLNKNFGLRMYIQDEK